MRSGYTAGMSSWHSWLGTVFLAFFLAGAPKLSFAQTLQQVRSVGQFYAQADGFGGDVVVFRDEVIFSNESYGLASIELGVPID